MKFENIDFRPRLGLEFRMTFKMIGTKIKRSMDIQQALGELIQLRVHAERASYSRSTSTS